jgi:tRNA-specific 2-thiouridylase
MSLDPKALNPGPIADTGGKIIGEHKGIAFYTIGQRKRLGIQSVKPYYVTHIDRQSNTVVVGLKEEAMRKIFKVKELNWIARSSLAVPMKVMVKIRSTMPERGAVIIPDKNQNVTIEFDEPQWAPASGQSAVFYSGDIVIGGGVIE